VGEREDWDGGVEHRLTVIQAASKILIARGAICGLGGNL
jgi:hypothetical protein